MTTNGHRRLRIAQVAPLFESVPPQMYGGTERIVSYLTEELVALGHDVTLFASGDSSTSARLVAPCARALRLANCPDATPLHLTMLEDVYRRAADFDIVHFHCDYMHYPGTRRVRDMRHVTTLHGRLDLEELSPLYDEYDDIPVVSISRSQRTPLHQANWVGNVYHGIPLTLQTLGRGGQYLAFVGRVSPEKRLDRAIAIAELAGMKLKVAAKIDRADRDYYEREIHPLLGRAHVEFLGELGEEDKGELLRNATALVFPIDWPEPFGLVMIEAMACGTPVIAFRNGSVPEVIDDGITGFIVESIEEAVTAIELCKKTPRGEVRARFEQRFSATRMACDYVELYQQVMTNDARDRSGTPGLAHPRHHVAHG